MPCILRRFVVASCVALAGAVACSSTGPNLPACTGTVTVSATAGTEPKFTWAPACEAEGLTVSLSGGPAVWSVVTPNANGIPPGVKYGITPGGATVVTAPSALATGTSYSVTLYRFDDGHGGTVEVAGGLAFVP